MKVLQITSDYCPNPLWGMGWHVNQLVGGLKEKGISVSVATASKSSSFHENIITTSIKDDLRGLSSNKHEIFNDFKSFKKWQRILAERILGTRERFDIIHCHNWMSWLTAVKLKQHDKNLKSVITFHFLQKQYELMSDNPIPTFHREIIQIENDAIENADSIIVLSDSQKKLLESKYNSSVSKKISLIPHSINFKTVPYKDLLTHKGQSPYIEVIFVGRVEKDKGIFELINAFNKLSSNNRDIRLSIVGDGPVCEELMKKYSHENINFYGYLNRDQLRPLLMRSHIFCLPSSSENLPLSVLEAMFFAVVPVFSEGESVPTIFRHLKHGLKVKLIKEGNRYHADVDDLTLKLKLLIENRNLTEKLSRGAYNYAIKNYSADRMTGKIVHLYDSLL